MPAYVKTVWTNEVPSGTPKYKITEVTDGDITPGAEIELITSVIPGTPVNATNLNKIEDGLEALNTHDHTGGLGSQIPENGIANNAITNAKFRSAAALSIVGRWVNSAGNVADIVASADGQVLRRSGTSLIFGQVTTGGIVDGAVTSPKLGAAAVTAGKINTGGVSATSQLANDIVDDTKVGNRVPQFRRRRGGGAANWSTVGTTVQTPTTVRMQAGAQAWTGGAAASGSITVNFPEAFSGTPLVFVTVAFHSNLAADYVEVTAVGASSFQILWGTPGTNQTTMHFNWLAIGPE